METLQNSMEIRRRIINKAFECGESCHLGGSLSMVDILSILFKKFLKYDTSNLKSHDRDIFILSKGHCVLGYYAAMNFFGLMKDEVFNTFQKNGSDLIAHPVKNPDLGVESSNGSLGQGLSFAVGIAYGLRYKGLSNKVFVLMGDGECNEGSVWESAASASEFSLSNLTVIVDVNQLRNDGPNNTYLLSTNLSNVWKSFGWNVVEVDGHNHNELEYAFSCSVAENSKPTVIVANTVKGHGVSFMENNNEWHHNRITEKVYNSILEEWL